MILVRENIDEIVNTCFSAEDAAILEFTQNGNRITIKDQFLFHYETACYEGTFESLKKAIMYKIYQNQDLLLKMKDYRTNLLKITELGEYSKVTLAYKDQLGTESTIGSSAHEGSTTNNQADQYSGVDQTENISIDDERTAVSQSNIVEKLSKVIPQPTISAGEQLNKESYELGENIIFKGQITYNKPTLNNPQMDEGQGAISFQNVTKDVTTNQSNNTNASSSSRGSESKGKSKSASANTNIKGSKLDESNRQVQFVTNDARIKLWKTELPKLQTKFWNSFYNLFDFEQF